MYLRGAKNVTAFDINPLTKYLFYLKRAALMAGLTKEEYLAYFCYFRYKESFTFDRYSFNEKIFYRIVPYLKGNSYDFWTELYDNHLGMTIREDGRLFNSDENIRSTLEKTIYYLGDKEYIKMQELAPRIKINFINKNIKDLVLSKKYDLMYFSNIIQYDDTLFNTDTLYETLFEEKEVLLEAFKDLVMGFEDNLNYDGVMILGYIYTILFECSSISIFNKKVRDKVFQKSIFNYEYFISTTYYQDEYLRKYPKSLKDAYLIYRKN